MQILLTRTGLIGLILLLLVGCSSQPYVSQSTWIDPAEINSQVDKSGEILNEFNSITIINNPYNLGYGASLKKGIQRSKGNWIMIVDSDGTYPVRDIGKLLKFTGFYDMVVGNRNHDHDYFGRKPAKWFLKKIASFLSGHKIPDLNSGMRIFRKSIAIEFFHLFPSGFSFTSTITLACFANDYTVKYVDIPYFQRTGQSGIKPRHFFDFIVLIIKIFVYFKPLKMLFPIFLLIFSVGIIRSVRDLIVEGFIGTLASLLVILSLQIFVMALITEVIIKKNLK